MDWRYRWAITFVLALLAATQTLSAEEWSRFRGPNGSGISADKGFPTEFGPDKNVLWRSAVRPGKSSPVLSERHVFLTAFADEKLYTQCFDRQTGKLLWEKSVARERKGLTNKLNDPAALTPVADGENVYVFFEDWGLLSYDAAGKLRWKTPLGPFTNTQGLGISPILVDGLVVLQISQAVDSYIAAFDAANGETVWKVSQQEKEGWATPLLYRPNGGEAQILTVGSRLFGAHGAKNGQRTLSESTMAMAMVASPVLESDTLYAFGYNFEKPVPFDAQLKQRDKDGDGKLAPDEYAENPFLTSIAQYRGNRDGVVTREEFERVIKQSSGPSRLVAMRLEQDGEGFRTRELWHDEKSLMFVIPSPLVYDGVLYYVKNGGILAAMDAGTGKILKRGRLDGAIDPYSASPVAAEGKIYFASEKGRIVVLKPGADWEVVAVNDLNEEIYATPALSGGSIFARTAENLYRFGK